MDSFIQQAYFLLTTSPGNLAYHLVLAFSLVAALLSAINLWQKDQKIVRRRMVFGLSLLLGLRFLLYVGAALAWQELIDPQVAMIVLDRAVELLSLVLIIWLWAYPEPVRLADAAIGVTVGLVAILGFYSLLLYQYQDLQGLFNPLSSNLTVQILGSSYCIVGCLILITRRPAGWFIGLIMLVILGVGYAVEWLFFAPGIVYAGAVRLAEMIAYPLLLALPQRFGPAKSSPALDRAISPGMDSVSWLQAEGIQDRGSDPKIQLAILSLMDERNPQNIGNTIAEIVGRAMQAEFCLLLLPPDESGHLVMAYSYELLSQCHLLSISLERKNIPILADAFERGRALRLPENNNTPDLVGLAEALNLRKNGALLAQPLQGVDGAPLMDIVLISPHAHHSWTQQDQDRVCELAGPLVNFMHRSLRMAGLGHDKSGNQPSLEEVQQGQRPAGPPNKSAAYWGAVENGTHPGNLPTE